MTTRNILRRVGLKIKVDENNSRRLFNHAIKEGERALLDGEEWNLPGLGKLMIELGDEPIPKVVFKPNKNFILRIESEFCENRELTV